MKFSSPVEVQDRIEGSRVSKIKGSYLRYIVLKDKECPIIWIEIAKKY